MNTSATTTQASEYVDARAAYDLAYDAINDAHGLVFASYYNEAGKFDFEAAAANAVANPCKCGREFRTTRARGLHLGAIRRQAHKAGSVAFDAEMKARREGARA